MIDLTENISMRTAGDYANSRQESAYLPLVYGDLTKGGEGGIWQAVCVDTESRIYALAGHPLVSIANGQEVKLFNKDSEEMGPGWTFDDAHNLESHGEIATVSFPEITGATDISVNADDKSYDSSSTDLSVFGANWCIGAEGFTQSQNNGENKIISAEIHKVVVDGELKNESAGASVTLTADQQRNEPLGVRALGRPDADGGLITLPVALLENLLIYHAGMGDDELDPTAYSRAWSRCMNLGYQAAGVITRPGQVQTLLTEILGDFLGSWWRGPGQRLRFYLDLGPGSADEGELRSIIRGRDLSKVSVTAKLSDVVNQAAAKYCYSHVAREYQAEYDGLETRDLASQGLYGEMLQELELKWIRSGSVARTISERLVGLLAKPRRIITCEENALVNLPLEMGDAALLSLGWIYDEQGRPLTNQVVRVLGIEPQLDQGTVRYTLLDTGFYKTVAQIADGTRLADGSIMGGGRRDMREY
jgi:hypothetical protein